MSCWCDGDFAFAIRNAFCSNTRAALLLSLYGDVAQVSKLVVGALRMEPEFTFNPVQTADDRLVLFCFVYCSSVSVHDAYAHGTLLALPWICLSLLCSFLWQ